MTRAHRFAISGWLVLAAGCGRIGFDPPEMVGSGSGGPGPACADSDLGSALGSGVATGSTVGKGNDHRCLDNGQDTSDVALGWTAPAAGRYTFDLCASDPDWDSALEIRDGCAGAELACRDDDDCPPNLHERVTLTLAAQQHIVIIIDGADVDEEGAYTLAITARSTQIDAPAQAARPATP